jgi:hypothetical protein
MNWKGFGRESLWSNGDTIPEFAWKQREKLPVSELRFEPNTSQIHEVYCYINLLDTFRTVTLLAAISCKGGSPKRILSAGSVNIISAQLQNLLRIFIYK